MDAAEYLRKSRMEEGMDTDEVLSRHRKALAQFAASHDIHIIATYEEVVSGESLYARPEMLRLLEDVEEGRYDAVLVWVGGCTSFAGGAGLKPLRLPPAAKDSLLPAMTLTSR